MAFTTQPTLEDDLIIIRPLAERDFQDLFAIASDPLIWEQHQNKDRYIPENFKKFFNESIASNGALVSIDSKSKTSIGSSRFKIIDKVDGVVKIGWSFFI